MFDVAKANHMVFSRLKIETADEMCLNGLACLLGIRPTAFDRCNFTFKINKLLERVVDTPARGSKQAPLTVLCVFLENTKRNAHKDVIALLNVCVRDRGVQKCLSRARR